MRACVWVRVGACVCVCVRVFISAPYAPYRCAARPLPYGSARGAVPAGACCDAPSASEEVPGGRVPRRGATRVVCVRRRVRYVIRPAVPGCARGAAHGEEAARRAPAHFVARDQRALRPRQVSSLPPNHRAGQQAAPARTTDGAMRRHAPFAEPARSIRGRDGCARVLRCVFRCRESAAGPLPACICAEARLGGLGFRRRPGCWDPAYPTLPGCWTLGYCRAPVSRARA